LILGLRRSLWAALLALLLLAPAAGRGEELRLGGRLESRFATRSRGCGAGAPGACELLGFGELLRLRLDLTAPLGPGARVKAAASLRQEGFATVETLADSGERQKVQPLDLSADEAYLDLWDLATPGLDLRLGLQRTVWGGADHFNPTDRVDAYDLRDPSRFDRRLPSLALAGRYGRGGWALEAVVVPLFTPALLGPDQTDLTSLADPSEVFDLGGPDEPPPEVVRLDGEVRQPAPRLDASQVGLRLLWQGDAGQASLLAWRGYDSLPQAGGAARLTGFQTARRVNLGVPLVYPRLSMLGGSLRGPLFGDLTAWVELAWLFPERLELSADRDQLAALVKLGLLDAVPEPLPSAVVQDGEPYPNVVLGLDWQVPQGPYLGLQALHGFFGERQGSDLHDYGFFTLRWPWGRVALQLAAALELGPDATLGTLLSGSLAYLHGDSVELSLGSTWMGGAEGTTLGRFRDLSHVRVEASASF